jgi:hypothetical protein
MMPSFVKRIAIRTLGNLESFIMECLALKFEERWRYGWDIREFSKQFFDRVGVRRQSVS